MGYLDGKIAIVTGAGQGIGLACAAGLAAEGATVVASDLSETAARAASAAESVVCDVRDEGQVVDLVAGTVERHGRVDVMVANAGIVKVAPIAETTLEDWRAVTAVNLDGVFLSVREAANAMAASGGGSIVIIASITGMAGYPLAASYACAKAACMSLARTAALEYREHGVRTNAICPGFIDTDMVRSNVPIVKELAGFDPEEAIMAAQGRYGTVDEVARLCAFLASERASFCNGGHYTVDGGATASLL